MECISSRKLKYKERTGSIGDAYAGAKPKYIDVENAGEKFRRRLLHDGGAKCYAKIRMRDRREQSLFAKRRNRRFEI